MPQTAHASETAYERSRHLTDYELSFAKQHLETLLDQHDTDFSDAYNPDKNISPGRFDNVVNAYTGRRDVLETMLNDTHLLSLYAASLALQQEAQQEQEQAAQAAPQPLPALTSA